MSGQSLHSAAAQGPCSIISINGAENSQATVACCRQPYLGRMPSYPIYLLIMFCSKLHLPNGHPVKHYLGNVNVRKESNLLENQAYSKGPSKKLSNTQMALRRHDFGTKTGLIELSDLVTSTFGNRIAVFFVVVILFLFLYKIPMEPAFQEHSYYTM